MAAFKLSGPLVTPAFLYIPNYNKDLGVRHKTYGPAERINISFRSFGGTETEVNGVVAVEHTASVETWYRPDITSDCRLGIGGKMFEILGEPEDINLRHQYLRMKVIEVRGGA